MRSAMVPSRCPRSTPAKRCSICKNKLAGFGNNAQPVNNGRCCDDCNEAHVIPARVRACAVAVTNGNAGHVTMMTITMVMKVMFPTGNIASRH